MIHFILVFVWRKENENKARQISEWYIYAFRRHKIVGGESVYIFKWGAINFFKYKKYYCIDITLGNGLKTLRKYDELGISAVCYISHGKCFDFSFAFDFIFY